MYARLFVVTFALMLSTLAHAVSDEVQFADDSVEVSLLTCSPHDEIYSLYGHTAIRYHDLRTGEDWTFNYGVFNFKASFFVARFLFGLTDYELGVVPFSVFKAEYQRFGCTVTEQVLNFTPKEKQALRRALEENYKPENRVYRYNVLYDNCTIRARDIIEKSLDGATIKYASQLPEIPLDEGCNTYRKLLHIYTKEHPWAQFGDDLCLGLKADFVITWRERQFLPEELMSDVQAGRIFSSYAGVRTLVKETRLVVEPGVRFVKSGFPLTPSQCFYILLALSVVLAMIELLRRRTFAVWDALLMALVGLPGIVVALLFFSQHPTTSTNLQIFLLCPATLFFIPNVVRRKPTRYWKISLILLIIFFLGFFLQDYAEGMEILALCLLLRVCMNFYIQKKSQKKLNTK